MWWLFRSAIASAGFSEYTLTEKNSPLVLHSKKGGTYFEVPVDSKSVIFSLDSGNETLGNFSTTQRVYRHINADKASVYLRSHRPVKILVLDLAGLPPCNRYLAALEMDNFITVTYNHKPTEGQNACLVFYRADSVIHYSIRVEHGATALWTQKSLKSGQNPYIFRTAFKDVEGTIGDGFVVMIREPETLLTMNFTVVKGIDRSGHCQLRPAISVSKEGEQMPEGAPGVLTFHCSMATEAVHVMFIAGVLVISIVGTLYIFYLICSIRASAWESDTVTNADILEMLLASGQKGPRTRRLLSE